MSQWKSETNSFQLFSTMETHIHQRDKYGNLVQGLYAFDVEVIEKGTNLSMPVADLRFEEVVPGIQLCSFSLVEPGNFMLMISDKEQNNLISRVPYDFTVYIGGLFSLCIHCHFYILLSCHHMLLIKFSHLFLSIL